jgi:hypothetical protein
VSVGVGLAPLAAPIPVMNVFGIGERPNIGRFLARGTSSSAPGCSGARTRRPGHGRGPRRRRPRRGAHPRRRGHRGLPEGPGAHRPRQGRGPRRPELPARPQAGRTVTPGPWPGRARPHFPYPGAGARLSPRATYATYWSDAPRLPEPLRWPPGGLTPIGERRSTAWAKTLSACRRGYGRSSRLTLL